MSTAFQIVASVCNAHRNSDLRADNRSILAALDAEFGAKDALLERARVALDNALVWAIFATARDPKYTHPQALKNAQDDGEQIKHLLAELNQK